MCNRDIEEVCLLPGTGNQCIRLRDEKGNHRLSLLVCGVDDNGETKWVDLATPDGKVVYCGVDIGLVNLFISFLGLESVD
jgi:hypothetical protein